MDTAKRIEEIRARKNAATQGPYKIRQPARTSGWGLCVGSERYILFRVTGGHTGESERLNKIVTREQQRQADAEFIANAPTDIEFLLSQVEELQSALSMSLRTIEENALTCKARR